MDSSRNLKSGMLSVYLISMTVFVDDFDDAFDDSDVDDDNDVSIDSSSSDAFFCRARATAKRIRPCRTEDQ